MRIHGNTTGLKPAQTKALERLFKRRVPPANVTTQQLNELLAATSFDTGRQVGVLVNRKGHVEHVMVGDAHKLDLPDLGRHRAGEGRLRGVRLLHTHLLGEELTRDDLTDLALLRLDYVAALEVTAEGRPGRWYSGWVSGDAEADVPWIVEKPTQAHEVVHFDFEGFLREL
ncbi:MAG: GTP-binding protein HflX, partial [Myxococcota bacterium]